VSPPHEQDPPVPATSRPLAASDSAPFDQHRWDAWVSKGRIANAAFAEKVRALVTLGIAIAVGAAGLWVILG
jgi:hypothetical protein